MENTNDAPNLDAFTDPNELWDFAERAVRSPRIVACEIFGSMSAGRTRATKDLGHYAHNKATAMRCQLAGDILAASKYEAICERIYSGLPEFARW